MAFDGLSWYRLNRPVTERESAARLSTTKSCSETAMDGDTVFSMSDACLEASDGNYRDKGRGLVIFALPGMGAFAATAFVLWVILSPPEAVREHGQSGYVLPVFGPLLLFMLCLCAVCVWALTRACFGYTRNPVRFNRANRMVYVFRHNGSGGVLSVPWDKAFFYVERGSRAGLTRTAPYVVRCLVLDDNGKVVDTFSVGRRFVLATDENSPLGQRVMGQLYGCFEYYRRFMEEGPTAVPPVTQYLDTKVSLRNSLKLQFEDAPDIVKSGHPALWLLLLVTALPSFIEGTTHYIAQLTCREPRWPEDVERACNSSATVAQGVAS
ncbi:hypothetical protein C0Z18_20585 [Trinickia dabaoshanensis]|uniref:DUF6708 domain-containing protein n=2 Tax=Trinickia dabaoshanensis TaxID=564714 RepID=A0A2N7VK17_9BURK|nr:DUF6708 domain-containing protein [Trinickia dabaoshanensis]PMS17482.1 hypothetical protein C0Z18_20585 [Trinickia dabaoshanensis]